MCGGKGRRLSTRPQLPAFALGTAALPFQRGLAGADEAVCVVCAAVNVGGMPFIDTSPLYQGGEAEAGVGRALADVPREAYRISTKTGYVVNTSTLAAMDTGNPLIKKYPPRDFSFDFTMRSCRRSLCRLGVEVLDILFLQDTEPDEVRAVAEGAAPALESLKSEGVIRAIGAGITHLGAAADLMEAVDLDVLMIAGHHTLLVQDADSLLAQCAARGIPVILAGPMNSGILADPFAPHPRFHYRPAPPEMVERAQTIHAICESHGVPLKAAALQYPLRHPVITTVMTGPGSMAEREETLRFQSLDIPSNLWEDLKQARYIP